MPSRGRVHAVRAERGSGTAYTEDAPPGIDEDGRLPLAAGRRAEGGPGRTTAAGVYPLADGAEPGRSGPATWRRRRLPAGGTGGEDPGRRRPGVLAVERGDEGALTSSGNGTVRDSVSGVLNRAPLYRDRRDFVFRRGDTGMRGGRT